MTVENLQKLLEIEEQIKSLKNEAETIKDEIKKEMGNEEHLEIGAYNVNWTITISTSLDSTRLKKEDPELWNRYSKEGITRRFSITAPKR